MSTIKRIYNEITAISKETGYSVDFLCERVEEAVEDCGDYNKALEDVCAVSLEHDW